jgi:peptidyl-prolyl cis-trans isomerase SurA
MSKKIWIATALLSMATITTIAQRKQLPSTDATLFSYGTNNVGKNEFLRMYTKNINNQKPDFSEKALRDYVTLYSRFKMKVAEAESMKMDTLPAIQSELNGYKKTLSKTYLTDKEVTEGLGKEVYERMKKDVHVAHILISSARGSDDTLVAYKTIDSIYKNIKSGKLNFEDAAKAASSDKGSAVNGGDLGFITALQVVYPFETIAYNTPNGSISAPFKTVFGYHIIKKIEERPARGEISVSQIMLNVQKSASEASKLEIKNRIDSIAAALKKGADFTALVKKHSQDKFSVNADGVLPAFKTGQMVPDFENAAFNLKKAGDISAPVKTDFGYHIIKLVSKTPLKPYDSVKQELSKKIEQDGRIEVAKQMFTNKLKAKLGYKENTKNLDDLINMIPDSVLKNGSFKGEDYGNKTGMLFQLRDIEFNQADFANYIQTFTGGRIYGGKETSLKTLFKNYSEKAVLDYQENALMNENEEYRNLINEYKDGIMLFELTDKSVWSKASTDTIGLEKFYNNNKAKYVWQNAANGDWYKITDNETGKALLKALAENTDNKSAEQIAKTVNGDGVQNKVTVETNTFEQSRFPKGTTFTKGKPTSILTSEDGSLSVFMAKDVYNTPKQKTLQEAKGYVISEYQEYLEKTWIEGLEAKYKVKVNESVLKGMVK